MSKQTAVEWLVEKVFCKYTCKWKDVIKEAKAMEKEQIEDAFKHGYSNGNIDTCMSNQQYYNETYTSSPKTSDN